MNQSNLAHRYESPAEPAESGTHRVAPPTACDELADASLALAQALVTIANAAARLERGSR